MNLVAFTVRLHENCIHTYIHTYIYTYIHIYIHTYIQTTRGNIKCYVSDWLAGRLVGWLAEHYFWVPTKVTIKCSVGKQVPFLFRPPCKLHLL